MEVSRLINSEILACLETMIIKPVCEKQSNCSAKRNRLRNLAWRLSLAKIRFVIITFKLSFNKKTDKTGVVSLVCGVFFLQNKNCMCTGTYILCCNG